MGVGRKAGVQNPILGSVLWGAQQQPEPEVTAVEVVSRCVV